jgi:type 1 glutamine amidotransferase
MKTPAILALAASASLAMAAEPIKTLLVTGHNNHNWQFTSRVHKETLEATGRFAVTVTDDPQTAMAPADALSNYQLIVLDYNDFHQPKRWGDAAEKNFLDAVNRGVGVVAIHSANNAFKGWAEYEKMIGLHWREGTGHGNFHEFKVTLTDREHPITKGLSDFTTSDELYHNLKNPQSAPYRLLAQAFDSKDIGGSGKDEPMAITLEHGKGRIFATPLGHVWLNSDDQKVSVLNDGFRTLLVRGSEWAATGEVTLPSDWSDVRQHNTLTPEEKASGWVLLFDGESTEHFRGFRQPEFPTKGWRVENGTIFMPAKGGGGDICTRNEYSDFEFECEWKVSEGGNSGIMYRSTEDHTYPWETGREMQILDDARHVDGKSPLTRAGTLYALFPCAADVCRPAGHWNTARVVAKGTRLQHWMNGIKVVDVDTESAEYKEAHNKSKFTKMPDFGIPTKGVIALQDHGDDIWFRNIKVRELK